jgi:hypothetical protein
MIGPGVSEYEESAGAASSPTYHDLHITTAQIPRTSIFNLPYGLMVTCDRTSGWELWDMNQPSPRGRAGSCGVLIAGEYDGPGNWLVLDVAGRVVVDSRERRGNGEVPGQ